MIQHTLNLYIRKGNCDPSIDITPIYKGVWSPVRHPRTDMGIGSILACFIRHRCVIRFYNPRPAFRNFSRIHQPNTNRKVRLWPPPHSSR
jgi:hypothetical protein